MIKELSIDALRIEISKELDPKRRSELGQFMTPSVVAQYMASLFSPGRYATIRLLDAGAGIGTLTAAFLERWLSAEISAQSVELSAYEIDPILRDYLIRLLANYQKRTKQSGRNLNVNLEGYDFIEDAVDRIQFWNSQNFTHAILNPPYKKIHSQSQHRKSLSAIGIETVNLYSAFLALTIQLMAEGGEIVAIIPRSFCNGPYYRPFRELLLQKTSLKHIHLFSARDKAFQDDKVLQENVIIHLVKEVPQETVTISTSTDDSFADYQIQEVAFEEIVHSDDSEQFIHIPTTIQSILNPNNGASLLHSLQDLNIQVSTGPVVDFRLKEYLRDLPDEDTVPLLYPAHFINYQLQWPNFSGKKPNSLVINENTKKWLFPNGYYIIVRRFSSKEERRRIVAAVVNPNLLDYQYLGFENHLNVFHQDKHGLSETLAHGLAIYLNSSLVDENFRRFSGHTQVNATDLRLMKYPCLDKLLQFGQWSMSQSTFDLAAIDEFVLRSLS